MANIRRCDICQNANDGPIDVKMAKITFEWAADSTSCASDLCEVHCHELKQLLYKYFPPLKEQERTRMLKEKAKQDSKEVAK